MPVLGALSRALLERYRCPDAFIHFELTGELSRNCGFFRFGPNVTCYGRSSGGRAGLQSSSALDDLASSAFIRDSVPFLPFDPSEIIENLRLERYVPRVSNLRSAARKGYYLARPALPSSLRKRIQKFQLKRWNEIAFPHWPVDLTIENLCEELLLLTLKATGADHIPFIWFWPEATTGCFVFTHDVETQAGRDFCGDVMDMDDSFGIKSSFQIVPHGRYTVPSQFLDAIRNRGFEIAIQDFNHDGRLFDRRADFVRRASLINNYAREYGAKGFRAGVLYRKAEWYDALNFSFDMSIPNVAHMDPQRGGCCTVMPFFIGNLLELPVTTTQDYVLFHLLNQRSIELWKDQINLILRKNGFASFIIHPDYLLNQEVKSLYVDLLNYVRALSSTNNIWLTMPSAVDQWWRARSRMKLVEAGGGWKIQGEQAERACLAYARMVDGNLVYQVDPSLAHISSASHSRGAEAKS